MSFTVRHIPILLPHIVCAWSGSPFSLETATPAAHLHRSALLRHPVAHAHTALLTGHLSESARHWPAITHHIVATAKSTSSHRLKLFPAWPSHWATLIQAWASHCPTPVPTWSGHLLTLPPAGPHLSHHSAMCPFMPSVELYEFPHFFSAFLHFVDDFAHFLPVVGLIGLDQLVQKALVPAKLFAGSCLFSKCLFHCLFRGEYRYCYQ